MIFRVHLKGLYTVAVTSSEVDIPYATCSPLDTQYIVVTQGLYQYHFCLVAIILMQRATPAQEFPQGRPGGLQKARHFLNSNDQTYGTSWWRSDLVTHMHSTFPAVV